MMKEQDDELEYIQTLTIMMRTHGITYLKNSRVELTCPPVVPTVPRENQPLHETKFKEPEMPMSMAMWGT